MVRCRALVLVVGLSAEDPERDLATLRDGLVAYDAPKLARPSLVVGTKADLVDDVGDRGAPGAEARWPCPR
ncbi:MAG: hypothetical protein U0V56_12170 [Actinomycetota bacterium]